MSTTRRRRIVGTYSSEDAQRPTAADSGHSHESSNRREEWGVSPKVDEDAPAAWGMGPDHDDDDDSPPQPSATPLSNDEIEQQLRCLAAPAIKTLGTILSGDRKQARNAQSRWLAATWVIDQVRKAAAKQSAAEDKATAEKVREASRKLDPTSVTAALQARVRRERTVGEGKGEGGPH